MEYKGWVVGGGGDVGVWGGKWHIEEGQIGGDNGDDWNKRWRKLELMQCLNNSDTKTFFIKHQHYMALH